MSDGDVWRRCSGCRSGIGFDEIYWVCNVSTCNRKRTGFFFCSVSCWEAHLPMMHHRESWAVEKRSPTRAESKKETPPRPARSEKRSKPAPARRKVVARTSTSDADDEDLPRDILIVASKLKKYIKARSGMNTSDSVLPALSDQVRRLCDQAIRNAASDERKTVLDRDIPS